MTRVTIPVTVTVTETYRFEVEQEWFYDTLPEDATVDDLWDAVKQWNASDPAGLWDWIDAFEADTQSVVLTRDDTGEQITGATGDSA